MDYMAILSDDEIEILCKIIGGKGFKKLFNKNAKEFSKIKPGFRANGLTDVDLISIAVKNKDKPFIYTFVNQQTETWMTEITASIEKMEQSSVDKDDIVAGSLINSAFSENVELYFKIAGKQVSHDYLDMIKRKMWKIRNDKENASTLEGNASELKTENERLKVQISSLEQYIETVRAEYAATIENCEQEKTKLETALINTQEEVKRLQLPPVLTSPEIDDYESRVQFDDTRNDTLPSIGSDQLVSLCEVTVDHNEQKSLIRHADLNFKGQLELFQKNEEISPYFGNRDRLFFKDGPMQVGYLGIWNWSAVPNEKDSSKDYVIAEFNPNIVPIEVVIILNCSSLEELIDVLQKGYPCETSSRRVMFTTCQSKGEYVGILCSDKDYVSQNGKIIFSDDTAIVPVYEFTNSELVRIRNGRIFYQSVFAGIPIQLYQIKTQMEIVKNIVRNSISWSSYKQRGATRAEYKHLKDYISALSTEDIILKICKACHCTRPAATQLLNGFIEKALDYIDGKSIDDEVIISAIFSSEILMGRAKELIFADWERENSGLLQEAQERLDSLNNQLGIVSKSLAEAKQSLEATKREEKKLTQMIEDKKDLGKDVELAVAERIQRAQNNVADFIASMAFVGRQSTKATDVIKCIEDTSVLGPKYVLQEGTTDLDGLEQHGNWSEVIDTTVLELQEAGVMEKHVRGLAAYLCAAYIEKEPLLLIGPNAQEIVMAFSAALSRKRHGILYCEGEYSNSDVQMIGNVGEDIVEIVNLFSSSWLNRLPEIFSAKGPFFLLTHPYIEDIQVEPKSIFNFMLPVCTEFFVDKKATENYIGGYFADNFSVYNPQKNADREIRLLSCLDINPFIRGRIKRLLTVMHTISAEATADDDFLFAILPLAYVTMNMDELIEVIKDSKKEITISAEIRRELQFVLGEI